MMVGQSARATLHGVSASTECVSYRVSPMLLVPPALLNSDSCALGVRIDYHWEAKITFNRQQTGPGREIRVTSPCQYHCGCNLKESRDVRPDVTLL
jgi:hypothetical protein